MFVLEFYRIPLFLSTKFSLSTYFVFLPHCKQAFIRLKKKGQPYDWPFAISVPCNLPDLNFLTDIKAVLEFKKTLKFDLRKIGFDVDTMIV